MIALSLESEYGTFSLSDLETNDVGAEAQPGTTGLGLPPIDVQWSAGAGDGATARGRRRLPRPMDIPIEIVASSRADLDARANKLSTVLQGRNVILRATEDGKSWFVPVERVGGGDYATGQDTNGLYNLRLTITVQAGDPFWSSSEIKKASKNVPGTNWDLNLTNLIGPSETWATYVVDGPGINFRVQADPAYADRDSDFIFNGYVEVGEKVIIDTKAGTVVDQDGNNRYTDMGPAPRFRPLRPNKTSVKVGLDTSSDIFDAARTDGRTNYVTNPAFILNADDWSLGHSALVQMDFTNHYLVFNGGVTTDGDGTRYEHNYAEHTITGLTPDVDYEFSLLTYVSGTTRPVPAGPDGNTGYTRFEAGARLVVLDQYDFAPYDYYETSSLEISAGAARRESVFFTPSSDTVKIRFYGPSSYFMFHMPDADDEWGQSFGEATIDEVYVGTPGTYFDSTFADTADINYTATAEGWSKAVSTTFDVSTAKVTCQFRQRKELML